MKTVNHLGFARKVIGTIMVVEDRLMKVIGHLGRQERIFLATEFIIKTGMK